MGGSVSMIDGHIDEVRVKCPCGLRQFMEAEDCEVTNCCDCCPLMCDDCVDLWGITYCRLADEPCAAVKNCPKFKEE